MVSRILMVPSTRKVDKISRFEGKKMSSILNILSNLWQIQTQMTGKVLNV